MKKFLFTLASFLMAGSMFATTDYCYINDFEVAEAELGTEIEVPVGIVAEALFSAYQFEVVLPEGMEVTDYENGSDAEVEYKNNKGKTKSAEPSLTANGTYTMFLAAFMENEYYQDADGNWQPAGAVMWRPGTYEEVCVLTIQVAEDFKGGEITIVSKLSCEATPIGDIVSAEYQTRTTTVTVEGGVVEPMDLTGEIIFGELDVETGKIAVSYDGPEEVTLTATINGEAVEIVDGFITLPEYGEYEVYVYANAEGYKEESRMKIFTWEEPVTPEVTATPVINVTTTDDEVTIEAVGDGEVLLYCDGMEVPNPMVIPRGDQDATYVFTATAQEEGKEISETATLEVTVPAKEVIEPEVTATPEINFNEETLTLTVEGDGEIHVYIDGEEVEVPYTFEPGDEEVTYTITATAQEEGKEISETATLEVTIPAKEVKVYEIPMPVVNVDEGEDAYTITATAGEGTIEGVVITLYVTTYDPETGVPTTTTYTDPAEVVIELTDADQYVSFYATATLEEAPEGYDDWTNNLTAAEQIVIPAKVEPQPEVTPTPEIIVTETDDAIIINVNGEGEIHVYVNGEEVEVPYTIEKGDEAQTIVVTATAQGENMEISVPAEETVVVPAKPSDDPHMVGHWLVLVDENGNEEWVVLYQSANNPNNWVNMYTFHHQPWGPVVRYYFVVDGVRYGAPVDMQPTAMGPIEETVQNPLYETEFYYTIEGGFTYTLGMQDLGEAKYVLCAQGGRVGVDETLAGKTIANVRYFNMAGQEMHEANGMTIVVTTYTDGTTSAVKVMQ